MYSVYFGFSFRCKKCSSFTKFTTHLLLAICFCIWTLRWTSCTRILHRVCALGASPSIQNSVEIFRLFFSISFVFALFCGSCGCRGLPILQNLGEARMSLSCATFRYSLHFNAQSGFNVLLSGICDLLRYIVILLERHRNQKLKQPSDRKPRQ